MKLQLFQQKHFGVIPHGIYKKIKNDTMGSLIFIKLVKKIIEWKKNYRSINLRFQDIGVLNLPLEGAVLSYAWVILVNLPLFLFDFCQTNLFSGVLMGAEFIFNDFKNEKVKENPENKHFTCLGKIKIVRCAPIWQSWATS